MVTIVHGYLMHLQQDDEDDIKDIDKISNITVSHWHCTVGHINGVMGGLLLSRL